LRLALLTSPTDGYLSNGYLSNGYLQECHPRLALLTSTVVNAIDDLKHALLIVVLLISAFACIR